MSTKQIIVIRKDLQMRKGKMVAQGAHASMAFMTTRIFPSATGYPKDQTYAGGSKLPLTDVEKAWLHSSFTKVCVGVNSEEELLAIFKQAQEAGLVVHLITDSGKTEFGGVATKTCLAIGPDLAEKIDPITGHLELL